MDKNRRQLLKASLSLPVLAYLPCNVDAAQPASADEYLIPEYIYQELFSIYGKRAYGINYSDLVAIKLPDIAENASIVQISVSSTTDATYSFVIFVDKNPKPLTSICYLQAGSELPVTMRIKVAKTSAIYVAADTNQGLVLSKNQVKVFMGGGCGG